MNKKTPSERIQKIIDAWDTHTLDLTSGPAFTELINIRDEVVALEVENEPTPASLRGLAEWFDDPKNPSVTVKIKTTSRDGNLFTLGYLLRCGADELERSQR